MTTLYVHAKSIHALGLCSEDRNVPGMYAVTLRDDTTPLTWVDAALDGFHSHVPVSVLEDFEFTVHDIDGVLIDCGINSLDAYILDYLTTSVEKIPAVGAPVAMPSLRNLFAAELKNKS